MKQVLFALLVLSIFSQAVKADRTLIIVQGAAGAEEYGPQFAQWRKHWEEAGKAAGLNVIVHGADEQSAEEEAKAADKSKLQASLAALAAPSTEELWLVLIGHGTYDGKLARFNLRGPDVSADELAQWIKPITRPVAVINCSSSSGPFMSALAGTNRIIITATRSGNELNFSRFGGFLAQAIASPAADLDKDGQTSLLEAYLLASRQTQEWYKEQGRLATEHALIEDTGDGLGTPAQWFRGVRAVKQATDSVPLDGFRANQWCLVRSERERAMPDSVRAQRDEIELEIAKLRERKESMAADDYYAALEILAVRLARVYVNQ